jgi:hypothetical protein
MSYPSNIFTDGSQLDSILEQVVDLIVANTAYEETDSEIVALREIVVELGAAKDAFIDLDSYPPSEPNTKALRERLMLALAGVNITNGTETVLP